LSVFLPGWGQGKIDEANIRTFGEVAVNAGVYTYSGPQIWHSPVRYSLQQETTMKRKTSTSGFKAKVAVEALKGQRTVNEIATEFEAHPSQVNNWKKQLLSSSSEVFGKGLERQDADFEQEREKLFSQIGLLKVEVDWLKKRPDISTEHSGEGRLERT